jgi:hypothetical protein
MLWQGHQKRHNCWYQSNQWLPNSALWNSRFVYDSSTLQRPGHRWTAFRLCQIVSNLSKHICQIFLSKLPVSSNPTSFFQIYRYQVTPRRYFLHSRNSTFWRIWIQIIEFLSWLFDSSAKLPLHSATNITVHDLSTNLTYNLNLRIVRSHFLLTVPLGYLTWPTRPLKLVSWLSFLISLILVMTIVPTKPYLIWILIRILTYDELTIMVYFRIPITNWSINLLRYCTIISSKFFAF